MSAADGRGPRLSRALAMGAGLLALALALRHGVSALGGPEGLITEAGALGPLAVVLVQTSLAPFPFPTEVFTLASAAAYGFPAGALLTWLAWTSGSVLQYALARRGAIDTALDARLARLPAWIGRLPVEHPGFLIAVRWLPMGFHLANLAAGVRGVPLRRQVWIAAVGSIPGALVWAAIGAGLTCTVQ